MPEPAVPLTRRAVVLALAGYVFLVGPFGEGGRLPTALAALHAVVLGLASVGLWRSLVGGAGRPRGRGTGVLALAAVALALSVVAASGASYPYAAGLGLMDRIAVAAAFASAATLLAAPADLLVLRNMVVLSGTAQAVVALAGAARGGPDVAARLFLNRNHLGAFLNLGLLLAAAAADDARRRGARRTALLLAGAATVQIAALLALRSRGALVGLAAGALLLIGRTWPSWTRRARMVAAGVALVAVVLGAALVAQRFARSDDPDRWRRLRIWEAALAMAAPDPWLGIGPGQFPHEAPRHTFPLDRTPVRYGRGFSGAHSAYLTLAVEDGFPAALLVVAGIGAIIILVARRPGTGAAGAAALGAAAALAALATQGLVEDVQERPVLVIGGALLAGSALACGRGWRMRPPAPRLVAAAGAVVTLALWCGACVALPYAAWREATAARAGGREALPRMRRAARLDPRHAGYHHDLAMAALNSGPPDVERYLSAAGELDEARRLDPREPRWALLRARLDARAARVVFSDPLADVRAAAGYAEAARLAPTDPRPRLEQAGHLADLGRIEEALAALEAALAVEPHYRRARILQAEILVKAGRSGEARVAWDGLLASDRSINGYVPDSGYAAEIVADVPERRAALLPLLGLDLDPAVASEVADSK
jgi:O-antigen ligase